MPEEVKIYEIGGRKFFQKKMVLGQVDQLETIMGQLRLPNNFHPLSIVIALGPCLPMAMAVLLIEEGEKLKGRDLPARCEFMEEHLEIETAVEVIDHFLEVNLTLSALEKYKAVLARVNLLTKASEPEKSTGSMKSAPSAPMETSPGETGSSGVSP